MKKNFDPALYSLIRRLSYMLTRKPKGCVGQIAFVVTIGTIFFLYYFSDNSKQVQQSEPASYQNPNPVPQGNDKPEPKNAKPDSDKVKVIRVIDGDTIEISSNTRVRYIGINAPELNINTSNPPQYFAKEALERNRELIGGKEIYLEYDEEPFDKYERLLAYIWLVPENKRTDPKTQMVNAILVKEGYARAYTVPPNIKYRALFKELQTEAQERKRGKWK